MSMTMCFSLSVSVQAPTSVALSSCINTYACNRVCVYIPRTDAHACMVAPLRPHPPPFLSPPVLTRRIRKECLCMCTYTYTCNYVYVFKRMCIFVSMCIYVYLYVYICMYLRTYVRTYVSMYVCMYVCVCMHIYIYICYPPPVPTLPYLYKKIPTKNRLSRAGGEATNTFQLSGPDFSNFQLSNFFGRSFPTSGQLSNIPTFQPSNSSGNNFGMLESLAQKIGKLECWNVGKLECWNVGKLGPKQLESWKVRPKKVGKLESQAHKHWTKAGKSAHQT